MLQNEYPRFLRNWDEERNVGRQSTFVVGTIVVVVFTLAMWRLAESDFDASGPIRRLARAIYDPIIGILIQLL